MFENSAKTLGVLLFYHLFYFSRNSLFFASFT